MSQEQSATMNLSQTSTENNELSLDKSTDQKKGLNPFKVLLLMGLGVFSLVTLVILSWPLVAWIGSLRVS